MLLDAKFTNVDEWKATLQAISDITEEAMFICNSDGITFRGIDPSHVALLNVMFPISSFDFFKCTSTFFGIHVNDLRNIFSVTSDGDIVELKIDNHHKLIILITGSLKVIYALNLIEKNKINTPIPKIHSKNRFEFPPSMLSRIISNVEKISEYITISSKQEMIKFEGAGMVGNVQMSIKKTDSEMFLFDVQEDSSSVYSLEYMVRIIHNIGQASKIVRMEYGTHTPIHLLFEMESKTLAEYYLAPIIET